MDVIPGSNRRLTARASIFVALPLVGVLLVGGVLSLSAAIEGGNAPTGSPAATETSKPEPPKSAPRKLAFPPIDHSPTGQSTTSPRAVRVTRTTNKVGAPL